MSLIYVCFAISLSIAAYFAISPTDLFALQSAQPVSLLCNQPNRSVRSASRSLVLFLLQYSKMDPCISRDTDYYSNKTLHIILYII